MSLLDSLAPLPASDYPRDHLSASFVEQLFRCPEQTRQVQVLGKREPPSSALMWGIADHFAHEYNFVQKITSHEDVAVEEVQDAFADKLATAVDEAGGPSEVEWSEDYATVKDNGTSLVALYHEEVSPRIQPVTVEDTFSLALDGVPVPVVGRIDLTTADLVIDRKTANKRAKAPKPQWTSQSLLYRVATGKAMEWHLSVKSGAIVTPVEAPALAEPYTESLVAVTAKRFARAADLFAFYMATYGPDEPWPDAMSHPWACGFCGFRPECSWWA